MAFDKSQSGSSASLAHQVAPSVHRVPRIGAPRGLSMGDCIRAVRAPFEEGLQAFLDLLYSDGRRAGVRGPDHAKVLFRRWLELAITHDRETGAAFVPHFEAVVPFYLEPRALRRANREAGDLSRKEAERAMREPFDAVLQAYVQRVFDPEHAPGIRDEAHACETFATFCRLLLTYQNKHGRD